MVLPNRLLSLLAAVCAARAASGTAEPAPILPGSYIVEYEDGQHDTAAFKNEIAPDADVKMDLKFTLFKGASIKFHDEENLEETAAKIAAMPAIKRIWPIRRYKIPDYTVHWTGDMPGKDAAGGATKRQGTSNDTFSPHIMTQVNQFRDKGIIGTGIKIAVIDSGVDYKHPALGGCFGPGCLVSFGTDLVGDEYNGTNTPKPGPDPMDCNGHGTHVSGIIAAQTKNPFGIIGAASGVTLGIYKVFGCDGEVNDDVLIQAYNMAYEAGADLITASIGGPSGWSEEAWSATVTRIVEMGVPCIVSAGNDGGMGLFYASTAADGKKVTAIASVDNVVSPSLLSNASYTVDNSAPIGLGYTAGSPSQWANVTLPLWAVNYNTTDPANGCDPYPANTPDLSNKIVLIRRGTCTFVQKATNAAAKGAKYILLYNNAATGTVVVDVSTVPGILGIAMVDAQTGSSMVADLAAGRTVTVAMTDPTTAPKFLINQPNVATGGYMSTYTSWGPTYEAESKPQLAAPGGNILSTYPLKKGGYASLSGTSMACPLTAAAYALIMSVRGTKDPKTIENLLSSTAKPTLFNFGMGPQPYLAPVPQQGSGMIQAYDAAYATTLLSVSSLAFNDTDNFSPVQNFSISNTGSTAVTYTLSNVGAGTGYTFLNDSTIFPDTFPNEMVQSFASIAFSETSFTIPAGQRKLVGVTVTPPAGLNAKRLPVYSGYVVINGSDGSTLSLPYVGVMGSLRSRGVLDPKATYLSTSLLRAGESPLNPPPVDVNRTFILPPPGMANDTRYALTTEQPRLSINLAFGSPLLMADVVPIQVCGIGGAKNVTVTDHLGVKSIGQVALYPKTYEARTRSFARWDGKLDNGKYVPPGTYKIVVRALHVFGDASKASEYDGVDTVPFRLKYLTP